MFNFIEDCANMKGSVTQMNTPFLYIFLLHWIKAMAAKGNLSPLSPSCLAPM